MIYSTHLSCEECARFIHLSRDEGELLSALSSGSADKEDTDPLFHVGCKEAVCDILGSLFGLNQGEINLISGWLYMHPLYTCITNRNTGVRL